METKLTNEEKAREIAKRYETPCHGIGDCEFEAYQSALEAMKWKDEQHKKEIADLQRKLNAEKELRKQVEDSVRGLPQPIKDLIKAMNMII